MTIVVASNCRETHAWDGAAWVWFTLAFVLLRGLGVERRFYASSTLPRWFLPLWLIQSLWVGAVVLLSISSYQVWRDGGGWKGQQFAFGFLVTHYTCMLLWTYLYFTKRLPQLGLFFFLASLGMLLTYMYAAGSYVESFNAWLLLPYGVFYLYVGMMSAMFWDANPASFENEFNKNPGRVSFAWYVLPEFMQDFIAGWHDAFASLRKRKPIVAIDAQYSMLATSTLPAPSAPTWLADAEGRISPPDGGPLPAVNFRLPQHMK